MTQILLPNVILSMFIMVMIGYATGCKPDDSIPPGPLVGVWKWTIVEKANCPDPSEESSQNIYDCEIYCSVIEFKQDGTLLVIVNPDDPALVRTGTYTFTDNHLSWCVEDPVSDSCNSGEVTFFEDTFQFLVEDDNPCDLIWHFEGK